MRFLHHTRLELDERTNERTRNSMSKGQVNFTKDNEYYTPQRVVKYFGKFDYDPATTKEIILFITLCFIIPLLQFRDSLLRRSRNPLCSSQCIEFFLHPIS